MKAAFKYFFLFLLFMFAGAMLISIPVLLVIFSIYGKNALGDDPSQNIWFMSMIILAGDLLVLFMFWKKRYSRFHFGISTNSDETFNYKKLYLWATVGILGCMFLDIFVQNYVDFPDVDILETLTGMMKNPLGLLTICLTGPIAEEAVFRGAIERRLLEKDWNPWYAIVISALFFAVAHFNFAQGATAMAIGIFMGWVYYRTRNLWPCIVCHVVNNTIATVASVALPEEYESSMPLAVNIALLVFGIAMVALAVMQLAKLPKGTAPQPLPEVQPEYPLEATAGTPLVEGIEVSESVEDAVNDMPAADSKETQSVED